MFSYIQKAQRSLNSSSIKNHFILKPENSFATYTQNNIKGSLKNPLISNHPEFILGKCSKPVCLSLMSCNCNASEKTFLEIAQGTHQGSNKNNFPGVSKAEYLMEDENARKVFMRALDSPREVKQDIVETSINIVETKRLNSNPKTIKKLTEFCKEHVEKILNKE